MKFFDFIFKDKELVNNFKRYIFYKNIYIFVNRLKNIVVTKNNNKVREILLKKI